MKSIQILIDTTIYGAAVGVRGSHQGDLDFLSQTEDVANSAQELPGMVARALASLNASISDLSQVIVSRGPGSFTGIRVGMAYAYGLVSGRNSGMTSSGSHGVSLRGVSSLLALRNHLAKTQQAEIVVFLPSTKTTGYAALCRGDRHEVVAIDCALALPRECRSQEWVLLGDWERLEGIAPENEARILRKIKMYDAATLALQAMAQIKQDEFEQLSGSSILQTDDFPDAIYLRKSSVEENYMKQQAATKRSIS